MSRWKNRRPRLRRIMSGSVVPLSIAFVAAGVVYSTTVVTFWVNLASGSIDDPFGDTLQGLQELGRQIAVDNSTLIAVIWPVILSLVAAVFFVGSNAPGRHSVERRIVALISISVTGIAGGALILSIVGAIGHRESANRLWLMVVASAFVGALTFWLGNDAFATRRRLRQAAKSDARLSSRLARKYHRAVGKSMRGAGWLLLATCAATTVITMVVVNVALIVATGASVIDAATSWEAQLAYLRFVGMSVTGMLGASVLLASLPISSSPAQEQVLRVGSALLLLPAFMLPALYVVAQEDGRSAWAVRSGIVLAAALPLLLLAIPRTSRLSPVWSIRCLQLQVIARYAREARRDWTALRKHTGGRGPSFKRPLRTSGQQPRRSSDD